MMGVVATVIYSYFFRKTRHNVLYVFINRYRSDLIILPAFRLPMTRVMDPNEYDNLLTYTWWPAFSNINSEIIDFFRATAGGSIIFFLRKRSALAGRADIRKRSSH